MASMDHPGQARAIPPEYALILFVAVVLTGIVMSVWPK